MKNYFPPLFHIFFLFLLFLIYLIQFPSLLCAQKIELFPGSDSEKELLIQTSHTGPVSGFAFSPDGTLLASGSGFGSVKIWDVKSRRLIRTMTESAASASAVSFNHDGKILASAGDETIQLWDVLTGKNIRTIKSVGSEIKSLVYSPDGSMLASGDKDGTIRIWNVDNGNLIRTLSGHISDVTCLSFSPNGKILASGAGEVKIEKPQHEGDEEKRTYYDNEIRLWDVENGSEIRKFSGHERPIKSVRISQTGQTLFSTSHDNKIIEWDITTGREKRSFKGGNSHVWAGIFSADGKMFASSTIGGIIEWLNVETGKVIDRYTSKGEGLNIFNAFAFSPDGKALAWGGLDGTIILFNLVTGRGEYVAVKRVYAIVSVFFSPDGQLLAGVNGKEIKVWNIQARSNRDLLRTFTTEGFALASVLSPDNTMIALIDGMLAQKVELIDLRSGKVLRTIVSRLEDFAAVAFSFGGSKLFIKNKEGMAEIWDVKTGELLETTNLAVIREGSIVPGLVSGYENDGFNHISVSGKYAVVTRGADSALSKDRIMLFDLKTGNELLSVIAEIGSRWVIIAPDGRFDTNGDLSNLSVLHWRLSEDPLNPVPLEILMRNYYEPNLFSRTLRCTEEGTCGQEFKSLPSVAAINRVQPEVTIKQVSGSYGVVDVTVEVESVGKEVIHGAKNDDSGKKVFSGVYDLRLFRDNQLVGVSTPKDKHEKFIDDAPRLVAETKASSKLIDTPEDRAWREANDLFKLKSPDIRIVSPTKLEYTFRNIKLPRDGRKDVEFTAYAFNSDKVKSATAGPVKFAVPPAISNVPQKGRAFVVSIGVNASENRAYRLQYAANDARKIQEILGARLKAETSKYSEVIQIPLISDYGSNWAVAEHTARKAIIKGVFSLLSGNEKEVPPDVLKQIPNREKIKAVGPEDTLIISYSGHGYTNQSGIFYLLPYDIGKDTRALTAEALRKTISSDELSLWMQDITAAEMIMIIDACQSSAAVQGDGFKPGPLGSRGLGQLAYDKDMKILSATQTNNVALEVGNLQQGLLSYALIQDGIVSSLADANGDKQISTVEWLSYAEKRVPQLHQEMRDGKRDFVINGNIIKAGRGRGIQVFSPIKVKRSLNLQQPSLFDFKRRARETILFNLPPTKKRISTKIIRPIR